MDALLAEADSIIAQQEPAPQPYPSPSPVSPAQPQKEESPGVLKEGMKAIAGGVTDAMRHAWNTIDEADSWFNQNFLDVRIAAKESPTITSRLAESAYRAVPGMGAVHSAKKLLNKDSLQVPQLVSDNETALGQGARSLVQFIVPFMGATKALKGIGMANAAVRGMAGGAATDFSAFDPHEKRLSNLIMEMSAGDPVIGKQVFEYLAADPNDTAMEGRLKNTLEGLGLGVGAELAVQGVTKGLKAWRAHSIAKGRNPAQAILDASSAAPAEDLTAHAIDTSQAPNMALADQIELVTGVKKQGPNVFQKKLDMAAALKEDKLPKADPQGLSLAGEEALQVASKESNPDAFLPKNKEIALEDPNAIPYQAPEGGPAKELSYPDQWKLIEEDPAPRKLYLDEEGEHLVMAQEAGSPQQLDLDLALPELLKKDTRTALEENALKTYKELQEKALEKALEKAPAEAPTASKTALEATPLEERIKAAQTRVDDLAEAGKDTSAAQRVLDSLLKKQDSALYEKGSALGKEAAKLDTAGDPLVDAIAANDEKLSRALGRQQGGFISPSMLANFVSAQAGGLTGYLSADDDATLAEKLSMAGAGALMGIGLKVGAHKVLSSAERAARDNPDPVVKALSRPEVANIAPLTEAQAAKKAAPVIHMDKVRGIVQAAREGRLGELAEGALKDAINFDRVDSEEAVNELYQAVQGTFQKELEKSAGGAVRSHDTVKQIAELTGTGLKSLEDRYQKVANLDSQVLADRQLLQASADKSRELIATAVKSGDDFAVLAAEKQLKLHAVIQAKVAGTRTEIARALAAMRIQASASDLAINEAASLLESLGGKSAKLDYFKALQQIQTDEGLNKAIRLGGTAKTRNALTEAIVMGKLWSPVTHAANAVGNLLVAVGGAAEKATASMIGKYVTRSANAIQAGEVKAQVFGMMGGIQDALGITAEGLRSLRRASGEALTGNFKGAGEILMDNVEEFGDSYRSAILDAPVGRSTLDQTVDAGMGNAPAISSKAFNLDSESPVGILVDALGTLNRLPGRALGASDELFWAINYRGELRSQAYRAARQEGLEGAELVSRIANLVENPTVDMRAVAIQAAQKGTFTEPLTGFGKTLQGIVDDANIGPLPVGRAVIPFVKTPYNIMKYAAERTPVLSLATDAWKADMKAGGYKRDLALARVTLGSTFLMTGYTLAGGMEVDGEDVRLVGGGEYRRTAENLNGEQAYSLKIGDKYYSFNRMDPIGMFLGLAADFRDISGQVDEQTFGELASAAALSFSRNISSKSYLSGFTELIDSWQRYTRGDEKAMSRYLNNQTASLIPASTLWNTIRKEDDAMNREVWSLVDAIKNRLPGFSKDLPPVRNVFGEPQRLIGGLGYDAISPIRTTVANTDPLASEIARLNIDLDKPPKTLFVAPGARGIDLQPKQYDRLMVLTGERFKEHLTELLKSPDYLEATEGNPDFLDGKEKLIRDAWSKAKIYGQNALEDEDKALDEALMEGRKKAMGALTGFPWE
ncbi:MAG: hypothetical protein QM739_13725 [Propionivibrio sp.]